MGGRVTSRESGVNEYGVPFATVLRLEREAHLRLTRALSEALRRWVDLERARQRGQEAPQLHREILELTAKALN
jgi:hypothetical protein